MNIKKILLSTLSFSLLFFFIGGFVHGALLPNVVAENAQLFRQGGCVYVLGFAVLFIHGLALSALYAYLLNSGLNISGVKYSLSIGIATSFINIINQLCWFNLTASHALIAIAYYPVAYLIWGIVLSKIYKAS